MPFDPFAPTLVCERLATQARAIVEDRFARTDHRPSADQYAAIQDLLEHLEAMANGKLSSPMAYVSAMPAGVGKSTALTSFAEALCRNPDYADVGMVIFCNQLAEVSQMAEALKGLKDSHLCVVCGEGETPTRELGGLSEADGAQIVIATQEGLRLSLKGGREFPDASRYHYRGRPRLIRCWDEQAMFARPVTLNARGASALVEAMAVQSVPASDVLLRWISRVVEAPHGQIDVPNFAALGVQYGRLEADAGRDEDLVARVRALELMNGKTGWVVADNTGSGTLVTYKPELPNSILPLTITDASAAEGVDHEFYEMLSRSRRIVRLREATKTYGNLAVRVVPVAASRSTFNKPEKRKQADEIIAIVCNYIREADDAVLCVSYKAPFAMGASKRGRKTVAQQINDRLTEAEQARVEHLTWGRHKATNAYRDFRRMIIPGLDFTSPAVDYASAGAALEVPMQTNDITDPDDHPTTAQVLARRTGRLRDSLMQAVNRGHVRISKDGQCGDMELVILQSWRTGLKREDLAGMFPGATIVNDRALLPQVELKGRAKDVAEIVCARLNAGETEISYPSIYEAIGMSRQDFGRLMKTERMLEWLAQRSLERANIKGGLKGLKAQRPV